MKNLIVLFVVTIFATSLFAQKPFDDLKNAEKAIKKFNSNAEKIDELEKGMALLESAFASDEVKSSPKALIKKGKMLKNLANAEVKNKTLDLAGEYTVQEPTSAVQAFKAYSTAQGMTDRKNEVKDINTGVSELENHLYNFAVISYEGKDYGTAYENFSSCLAAHELLKSMGQKSRLDDPALFEDAQLFTAVSGYVGEKHEEVTPFLEKLYNEGHKEAVIYEYLYNIKVKSDPENSYVYLEKGLEVAPEESRLLFAYINDLLKRDKTDQLIDKLELAIEQEPNNPSIYLTLGNVYDRLSTKETDATKAQEHFTNAQKNYDIVLEKDPSNFDALYSNGALFYNNTASYVDQINALSDDLTSAGLKKSAALKKEMDDVFREALPYFLKAEQVKPKDGETIKAIKEIYARLNDLEKAAEYKSKYEAISAGN